MLQRQLRLGWQAESILQHLLQSYVAQQPLDRFSTPAQLPVHASCSQGDCAQSSPSLHAAHTSHHIMHDEAQQLRLYHHQHPATGLLHPVRRHYSSDGTNGVGAGSSSSPPAQRGGPPGSASPAGPQQLRISLQEALVKLVDAAVEQVEQGRTEDAVAILKEGIATFEPNFPESPELGELHNQVALLSLVAGDVDSAVTHATAALNITRKHFAGSGALMGHRQLRLGVSYFAQGRLTDAVGLLHSAEEALATAGDASSAEAQYYLTLSVLAGTRDVGQVAQFEGKLLSDLRSMKSTFGADSMIVSLALSQHDRIVHQPLSAAEPNPMLCEALLKQHAKLLESVNPNGEDLAVANYKLATFYYVHDMLPDAQSYIRQAGASLRALLPEEHDLVALCKHRLGMICAVSGDHRAATQLLTQSLQRFGGTGGSSSSGGAMSGLAREADFGLAVAKYKALGPVTDSPARAEALKAVRASLDEMAAAIGLNHMLVRGAMRHFAQMKAMAGL